MKICVYGKKFDPAYGEALRQLFVGFTIRGIDVRVHAPFRPVLEQFFGLGPDVGEFRSAEDLEGTDVLISIGGDGTMLECARIAGQRQIPTLGINTGRLGFLSTVGLKDIPEALDALQNGRYTLDRRSLIHVRSDQVELGDSPYALNEVSILNRERNSMIRIHAYVNDTFMNTYWADGLIAATPTGSTAYSLSCGGPIVSPDSNNLILTPIAAHNLAVRPVVLPDHHTIRLRAEGRDSGFLLMIDSDSFQIGPESIIELTRAPFDFPLIALHGQDFFQTIRNKMSWGLDKRN